MPDASWHGAQTMFYMTWVEQNETASDQAIVEASYLEIAQQLGADVAPVGIAWQNAFAQQPGLVLPDPDGFHSNEKGSSLAACVFYAALYGTSPAGAPSPNPGVGTDAGLLQATAWTTWQGGTWSF